MRYRLIFEKGLRQGTVFETDQPVLTIGRDPLCGLVLTEKGISRRHAVIEEKDDGIYIRDLNSINGLYINHEKIEEKRLETGDIIEIGGMQSTAQIIPSLIQKRQQLSRFQLLVIIFVLIILASELFFLTGMALRRYFRQLSETNTQVHIASLQNDIISSIFS